MTKETLNDILKRAPGVEGAKNQFKVADQHEVTLYLGMPGRAMPVAGIVGLALDGEVVEIRTREAGTVFVTYDAVSALAVKAPKAATANRAGFA